MLERYDPAQELVGEQPSMDGLKVKMSVLQQRARALGIPVVIVFEGFDAAGKGEAISGLIESLDPRGFKVRAIHAQDEQERRYPLMHRYHILTPADGQIAIFDRSWYRDVSTARLEDHLKRSEIEARFLQIADLEGKLRTGGALVLKFFLYISKKEQRRRFERLESDKATRWRVTKANWARHKRYDEHFAMFDEVIERTDYSFAPWHVVPGGSKKYALRRIYEEVISALEREIAQRQADAETERAPDYPFVPYVPPIQPAPIARLREVDLSSARLEDDQDYRPRLRQAQKRLRELHYLLYKKRIPMVLGFEGWDAAGKGGSILRLTQALDPRGFEVNPTGAPDATEKAHHYLWRFWNRVPKDGHIAVFDRTWYGRVMVERVEGLCREGDWQRAYGEINHFEKALSDWGAIMIKFWLQISSDEQLRRFNDRQNTPEKRYKITDEDWRNREKWPQYEQAVDEMLQRTNTAFAPWVIVPFDDKHFGRLKVLETVIEAIEARLE